MINDLNKYSNGMFQGAKTLALLFILILINSSAIKGQTVTINSNLTFGSFFVTSTSGGTITVSTSSGRTSTGSIVVESSPAATRAQFNFAAGSAKRYVTSITRTTPVTLTGSNGGTMSVALTAPSSTSFTVNAGSSRNINIGGTLTVGSLTSNPPGVYTGNFTVTINYN